MSVHCSIQQARRCTTRFAQYQCRWDAQFEEYYTKEIHPDSIHSTARWRLEQLDIYNPYSGVTNNQSESLNRVIKDFQFDHFRPKSTCIQHQGNVRRYTCSDTVSSRNLQLSFNRHMLPHYCSKDEPWSVLCQ